MPPLRTFLPVAPVKTERTHEENQERAYIAASRRSDRSLEARVESARRASEIHKRRTGRSLRVTEQDVLNEEMYEEEDDDLPSQYRRLTAHLQTGSADFNRRLAAYLTNHVAMRSALDQAITASYAQQFPNAPQFAHNSLGSQNNIGSFPSPFAGPSTASAPPSYPLQYPTSPSNFSRLDGPSSSNPATPTTPHQHRSVPYPMPGMRGYRNQAHHRAASISTEKELEQQLLGNAKEQNSGKASVSRRASLSGPKPDLTDLKDEAVKIPNEEAVEDTAPNFKKEHSQAANPLSLSPFTTSLPPDTQQLLGPMLDPNDPFTFSLMSGSGGLSLPQYDTSFYNYAPKDVESGFLQGMNSTLAPPPSSQETKPFYENRSASTHANHSAEFQSRLDDLACKNESFLTFDGEGGSAGATPGADGAWDAFIDDSPWNENGA